MTEVFETSDPDLAEAMLTAAYPSLRMTRPVAGSRLRLEHTQLTPSLRLERNSVNAGIYAKVDAGEAIVVGEILSGRLCQQIDGDEHRMSPGDLLVSAQPGSSCCGYLDHVAATAAVIDPALLNQVAAAAPHRESRPVRFTGYTPISAEAAAA